MYRVVLDANQLVSAFIKKTGFPARILDLFKEGIFEIVVTPSIIEEVENVLNYPRLQKHHGKSKQEIKNFLFLFADLCIDVDIEEKGERIVEQDPTDDKYLICALKGHADFVISGDKHLLNISSYKNVRILTPREFLRVIRPG